MNGWMAVESERHYEMANAKWASGNMNLLPIHISTYHRKSYEYQITAILRSNCNVRVSGGLELERTL